MNHALISIKGNYTKDFNTNEVILKIKYQSPLLKTQLDPTIENIAKEISIYFQVPLEDWTSKSRKQEFCKPRQIYFYLCRKLTLLTQGQIGKSFGMTKDHSTVNNAEGVVSNLIDTGDKYGFHAIKLLKKFEQK